MFARFLLIGFFRLFFLFLLFAPYADAIRGDAFNPRVAQCERQLCLLFTVMGNNHNSTLPLPHSRTSFVELAAPQRISQLNFGKYKQQQQWLRQSKASLSQCVRSLTFWSATTTNANNKCDATARRVSNKATTQKWQTKRIRR